LTLKKSSIPLPNGELNIEKWLSGSNSKSSLAETSSIILR
jgi:hypothetical protein